MLKVSVIIPTYNRAAFLSQCVESVLRQDYSNLEVVISDNASTDDTAATAARYLSDQRVRYFRNSVNLGMVPNQRKGLFDYATGDWAIVLDDDDYFFDASYISKAMRLASEYHDVVIVHANCRILYEKAGFHKDTDKRLPSIVDGRWMFLNYRYAVFGTVNFDKLTTLFNRKIALELDFFREIILSADRESFLKLALRGRVGFISDVAAVYRVHGRNLSSTFSVDDFFANMKAVLNPYDFARRLHLFEAKNLDRWKRRMVRESAEIVLIGMVTGQNFSMSATKDFTLRLCREYPFCWRALLGLLRPKILAKFCLNRLRQVST